MPQKKKLPEIKQLFKAAWKRTIKNLEGLIKLLLFSWLGYGLIIGVSSAWLVFLGVSNQNLIGEAFSNPAALLEGQLALKASLILLVFVLLLLLFSSLVYIVKLKVLSGEEKVLKTAKKSLKLVLPLVGVNLLLGILGAGGMWLFLLPGLIIFLFTVFAPLEVILANRGIIESLQASVGKVKARLGEVLLRLLALLALLAMTWMLPAALLKSESLGGMLWTIVRIFAGWYSLAYLIELYEHLEALESKKRAELWWLWLVAILGWALLIGLAVGWIKGWSAWGKPALENSAWMLS